MSTIDDIKQERTDAVARINRVLKRADELGIENDQTDQLEQIKLAVEGATVDAILASPELRSALKTIGDQTGQLTTVAQVMKDVTDFNGKIGGFLDQAGKIKGLTG